MYDYESEELPDKLPVIGGLGRRPDLEGTRNTVNSPELFPSLEAGSYAFLYKLSSAAIVLEQELSLKLTPTVYEQPFIHPTVKRLVDVAERLVFLKPRPEDDKDKLTATRLKTKDPQPRDYVISTKELEKDTMAVGGKEKGCVDKMQMEFTLPRNLSAGRNVDNSRVSIVFDPRSKIRYYGREGRRMRNFDDLNEEEVRESFGLSPGVVSDIIESRKIFYPSLEMKTGGVSLKVEFHDGAAVCRLGVRRRKYSREEKDLEGNRERNVVEEGEEYEESVSKKFSLGSFLTSENAIDLSSQQNIDKWLSNIAKDMYAKAKVKDKLRHD